ncbi:MAG: class I SAM-dependent methyltransferase [Candidatus Latescibacteria bacterium]|nr:class I SAM-dependent methyltransferase [Candidatus Latescibacterota bacterium]
MKNDSERWLKEKAKELLKEVGIKKGQIVLDFGCGCGYYTIPAAKIVGNKGKVYALDKDRSSLHEVMQRANSQRLENIQIIQTSGELKIPLEDESVDIVLLYDVLHSYYFSPTGRKELLAEIHRISKPNALISVFPKHMDSEDLRDEMEEANFHFERRLLVTLFHAHSLEQDYLLNFRKKMRVHLEGSVLN